MYGGAPPKLERPVDKMEQGKTAAEAAESSQEAQSNTARKEASIATGESSHEFKGTTFLS